MVIVESYSSKLQRTHGTMVSHNENDKRREGCNEMDRLKCFHPVRIRVFHLCKISSVLFVNVSVLFLTSVIFSFIL